MGIVHSCCLHSCCLPRYDNPNMCHENHTSTPKTKGLHRRNLSAVFNFKDDGDAPPVYLSSVDQLDVNSATEEQLMTLPGINRDMACNIVEHRRQIGVFKKVEDLALVSGVGATKLMLMREEICVRRPTGSTDSSLNDLSAQDNSSRCSRQNQPRTVCINVNVGNVFQLMRVPGLSQGLAENVVMYRDRKGPFQRLDDLVKVKGISAGVLSAVRPYLSLGDAHNSCTQQTTYTNGHLRNSGLTDSAIYSLPRSLPRQKSFLGKMEADLVHIGGPLSQKLSRTKKSSAYVFHRDGLDIIRIATWNLEKFTSEKVMNPGVREVICMTLFENGVRILAVQELRDSEALHVLCEELNNPTIPNVCKWSGHRGTWKCVIAPETSLNQFRGLLGFLFDTSCGVELKSAVLLDVSCQSHNARLDSPFCAKFKVKERPLTLVNAHVVTPRTDQVRDGKHHNGVAVTAPDPLNSLASVIEKKLPDSKGFVLLGDFNSHLTHPGFAKLQSRGFDSLLSVSTNTNVRYSAGDASATTETSQSTMWLRGNVRSTYTGHCGVVREGLSNPWIPDGWSWGGVASSHCPVWAEFYINDTPLERTTEQTKSKRNMLGCSEDRLASSQ